MTQGRDQRNAPPSMNVMTPTTSSRNSSSLPATSGSPRGSHEMRGSRLQPERNMQPRLSAQVSSAATPMSARQQHQRHTATAADEASLQGWQQGSLNGEQQIWLAIGKADQDVKKLKDDRRIDVETFEHFKLEFYHHLAKDEARWKEQRVANDRLMGMVRMLETEAADLRARVDKNGSQIEKLRARRTAGALATVPTTPNSGSRPVSGRHRLSVDCGHEQATNMNEVLRKVEEVAAEWDEDGEEKVSGSPGKFHRAMTLPSIGAVGRNLHTKPQVHRLSLTVPEEGDLAENLLDGDTLEEEEQRQPVRRRSRQYDSASSHQTDPVLESSEAEVAESVQMNNDEQQALDPPQELEFAQVQSVEAVDEEAEEQPILAAWESERTFEDSEEPVEEEADRIRQCFPTRRCSEDEEEWDYCEHGSSASDYAPSTASSGQSHDAYGGADDDEKRKEAGQFLAGWNETRSKKENVLDHSKLEQREKDLIRAALIIQRIWRFGARRFDFSAIMNSAAIKDGSRSSSRSSSSKSKVKVAPKSADNALKPVPRMARRKTVVAQHSGSSTLLGLLDPTAPKEIASGALLEAVEAANEELSLILLLTANQLMVNQVDQMGRTALHISARHGMATVCDAILRNRNFERADAVHVGGWTALHIAARQGRTHVVEVILKSDRFHAVNCEDENGRTALHCAAVCGNVDVVRRILEHPGFTSVDLQNFGGFTALHVAERHGHAEVCKVIAQFSKDPIRHRPTLGELRHRRKTADRSDRKTVLSAKTV